jgi:hypothetical protein
MKHSNIQTYRTNTVNKFKLEWPGQKLKVNRRILFYGSLKVPIGTIYTIPVRVIYDVRSTPTSTAQQAVATAV